MREVYGMTGSVLIVDDNIVVRKGLVRLFADGGFEVCGEAANGQEVIDKAQGLHPSLIVMDISMPVMNGIEAARRLRQLLPMVPIILLSDYGAVFPDEEAHCLGVAAVVSKVECSSSLLFEARALLGHKPAAYS
jgi:CheY-like chemotaxis protein